MIGTVNMNVASANEDELKPVMLYTFNDETGKDEGAAQNDAVAVGQPKFGVKADTEEGPAGKYLLIDSNEDYFLAPGGAFDFGTDAFTTSFWVKLSKDYPVNLGERFFQTGVWGPDDPGFVIAINRDGGGNVSFGTAVAGVGEADPAGSWSFSTVNNDFFDDKWHLITIVFDQPNKQYTIYLDGVQAAVKGVTAESLNGSSARQDVGIGVFYFNGELLHRPTYMLDDVTFYKQALTAEQIAAYYTSENGAAPATNAEAPDAETTLTDDLSGTSVTGIGLKDASLYVSPVLNGSAYEKLMETYKSFDTFMLYNIAIEKEGVPFAFSEDAVVKMAIPEKLQTATDLKAVLVKEDGTLVTITAMSANQTLEFRTKELGSIGIVSGSAAPAGADPAETGAAAEASATAEATETSASKDKPDTGMIAIIAAIAIVLLGGVCLLLYRKKKSRS